MQKSKNYHKKLLILGMILAFTPLLSGCSQTEAQETGIKTVKVAKPQMVKMSQTLELSGALSGIKETVLSIESPGKVDEINVGIGDEVKKGELLATLAASNAYTERYSLSKTYENSLSNLENTKNFMQQKINETEIAYKQSEQKLTNTENTKESEISLIEEKIKNAQLELDLAEINRDNIDNSFAQKEKDILDSTMSAISQTKTLAGDIVSYLYLINDSYEEKNLEVNDNFGQKNLASKQNVELTFIILKNAQEKLDNFLISNTNSEEDILTGRDLAQDVLQNLKKILTEMNIVLDNTIEQAQIDQSTINQYRSAITGKIVSVESLLLSQDSGISIGLLGTKQALLNLGIEKENKRKELNKLIELTKQQIQLLETQKEKIANDFDSEIALLELQIEQTEENIKTTEENLKSQVQQQKTQSDIVLGNLNSVNTQIRNTKLFAPYNGVIAEKYLESSSVMGAGTPVLKIADITQMKLVVYIPENFIKYISKDTVGVMTSDLFPDEKFEVKVERISPQSEKSSRKVRVEFVLDNPGYLKIGMLMNLEITLEETPEEILTVPTNSIIDYYDDKLISIVENNKIVQKNVKTGLTQNELTQIIEGLDVDDDIIIDRVDALEDGEEVQILN